MRILFALFILLPLAELYLLIEVGGEIGGLSTIGLCLLTAAIGGMLVHRQGLRTLQRAKVEMAHGGMPGEHMFQGVLLALAGIALFIPGFITDAIGFLLLVPGLRRMIIHRIAAQPRKGSVTIIEAEVIRDRDQLH